MHLVVATPCYGGLVTQRYLESICALLLDGSRSGVNVSVETVGCDSLITRARNTLVAKFLDLPTATHLLFVDADIAFDTHAVVRMLAFDKDVVAGIYPLKLINYDAGMHAALERGESLQSAQTRYVGVLEPRGERIDEDGFSTGVYAGTGFMLIKRAAIERMAEHYPETKYSASHNGLGLSSSNLYALFDCIIDPDTREYLSEDYTFCHRWRQLGGRIWLDRDSKLMHIGSAEFTGDARARFDHLVSTS